MSQMSGNIDTVLIIPELGILLQKLWINIKVCSWW